MKITVFSISLVPDTELGRHLYKLDNLNEKDVAKILFHKRKQETRKTEELRLAVQRVAALTHMTYTGGEPTLRTHTVPEDNEADVLAEFFDAAKSSNTLVTWNGALIDIPLLRYRAMHLHLRAARFWRRIQTDAAYHLDLAGVLFGDNPRAKTDLEELAVCTGLPGLMEAHALDPWKARQGGDFQALRARTELEVLNLYLLALRFWFVTGRYARKDIRTAESELHQWLAQGKTPHMRAFRERWRRD